MYANRNGGGSRFRNQRGMLGILSVCVVLVAFGGLLETAAGQTEENKALIRDRWLDMMNTANHATADEIFAADFT